MLRRAILMLTLAAVAAVVLAVGAGGAPAAEGGTIYCVSGKVCKGDSGDNLIVGSQGNDDINPFGGNDTLRGGFGLDEIYGNTASTPTDGVRDLIDCAYLGSRGDPGPDVGFGDDRPIDTVV